MDSIAQDEITQIRGDLEGLDERNLEELLPLVYHELRRVASAYLRNERVGHTLQTTALVHEAYARLAKHSEARWNDRGHFFRVAAKTMRRILVNHAVKRRAAKRGAGRDLMPLDEVTAVLPHSHVDLVALDEILQRLAANDERKARVVELRFFAGCTSEEIAEALGVSKKTVDREWRFARSWLQLALADEDK